MNNIDENEKNQIDILNNFILNIDCLDELNKCKNDVNFFEVTGMVYREIKHSNFLAWIFDSNASHKLGNSVIIKFIQLVISANQEKFDKDDLIQFSLLDYYDFIVKREWGNIDIFLVSDLQKVTITIENKIHAEEGKNQTKRYRDLVQSRYRDYKNIYIFLTVEGYVPGDEEHWCVADYYQIVNSLEYALEHIESITDEVKFIVNDYISMIRRRILMDDKVQELCYKIYKNNKAALDLIYRNLPNEVTFTRTYLLEKLNNDEIKNKYHISSVDRFSTNTYIRFTTTNSLKLFPDSTNKGGWDKSFKFMYEIHPQANGSLLLEGVISDANDETVKKVFEISKENGYVHDKETLKLWSRTFRTIIIKDNLSNLFIEDIMEEIEKSFVKSLDEMQAYEKSVFEKVLDY